MDKLSKLHTSINFKRVYRPTIALPSKILFLAIFNLEIKRQPSDEVSKERVREGNC